MKKAIVSFSGGLDSTSLILHLLSKGYEVRTYSFDYGQTHDIELKLAAKNISYLQSLNLPITHQIIDLKSVFNESNSCLCTHDEAPSGDYRDETMKVTVVENRNIIFSSIMYSKALAWANKTEDEVTISLGVHAGDHAIYPDCTEESVNMSRELYRISNWGSERVIYDTPFVNLHKGQVLQCGVEAMKQMKFTDEMINTVLSQTNSCYNNTNGVSCGTCGTCVERKEAFEFVGINDPIEYAE